jgi:hypothetical protein
MLQSMSRELVKIGCSGSLLKKACSRSGLSLALLLALWGVTFLERVYGGLKFLRRRVFLFYFLFLCVVGSYRLDPYNG